MSFADVGVTADGVVLVGNPHGEDDVERCGCVVEELGHDGFHSYTKTTTSPLTCPITDRSI